METVYSKAGKCACGAVRFKVLVPNSYGVCHCNMCRRWTGGVWMGVVCEDIIELNGPIKEWRSSQIGSRGFCEKCGSSIWHKPKHTKKYTFGQGLFENQSNWMLTREIFSNEKPAHYSLASMGQRAFTGWGTLWALITGRLPK